MDTMIEGHQKQVGQQEKRHKQSRQCKTGHDWYREYCVCSYLCSNNGSCLFVSIVSVQDTKNLCAFVESLNEWMNYLTEIKLNKVTITEEIKMGHREERVTSAHDVSVVRG